MLPRKFGLPGHRVPLVLNGITIYRDANLVIKAISNELSFSRTAIIISKRFLSKAVNRNRLKRQLVSLINQAKIAPGFDLAVLVKK